MERALILPDAHTPYHDKKALEELILGKVLRTGVWDTIIILGDWFDMYAISRFTKNPKRLRGLKNEVKEGFRLLRILEEYPFKRRVFINGNHEQRLSKATAEKMPEVYEYVMEKWQQEWKPDKWEVVEYMDDALLGKVYITHDVGLSGPLSTRQTLHAYQDNVIMGHNHNMLFCVEGNAKGIPHVGASFGWLGNYDKIDYKHRMKARREWALGFGYAHVRKNGWVYIHPTPIIGYSCVVDGQLFTL